MANLCRICGPLKKSDYICIDCYRKIDTALLMLQNQAKQHIRTIDNLRQRITQETEREK